jgi:hypothetical protein
MSKSKILFASSRVVHDALGKGDYSQFKLFYLFYCDGRYTFTAYLNLSSRFNL